MSGEQVEQMKKRIEEAKMEKRNESRKMHTVKYCGSGAAAVAAIFVVLPNTRERGVCQSRGIYRWSETRGGWPFRDYQYDNGGHAADIKTPGLTVKERRYGTDDGH